MLLKLSLISNLLLLVARPAWGSEKWLTCMDKGDFSYSSEDSILSGTTTTSSKTGCKFTFSILGGKGEKYEIDICDPQIHVDHFATLESAGHRILAEVAGCPAPTFGADFDANAKQYNEYKETKKKVFDLLDKVRDFYAEELNRVGIHSAYDSSNIATLEAKEDPKEAQEKRDARFTAARVACAKFLLHEYLNRCMSFEAKKVDPAPVKSSLDGLVGVHPADIKMPAKK